MRPRTFLSPLGKSLPALALCLFALVPPINAFTPEICSYPNSVSIEGKAMYIQSGMNYSDPMKNPIGQTFSIDLSTSWKASSPPYKALPEGYVTGSMPSALFRDQKNWFIMVNKTAYSFNIEAATWTPIKHDLDFSESWYLGSATDPGTGKVYVVGGYRNSVTFDRSMLVYDESTKSFQSVPMPQPLIPLRQTGTTWSTSLKSLVVFGGFNIETNTTRGDLYAYHPEKGWTTIATTGEVPSSRNGPCFVPAYSGKKLVLFGGQIDPPQPRAPGRTRDDIYTLDLETLVWTRGNDAGLAGGRVGAACTVSGDHLIAWGGYSTAPYGILNDTIVYNLKTAEWVEEYVPNAPESGSKGGVIGGTIAAVVIVLAITGALFWHRRKSQQFSK